MKRLALSIALAALTAPQALAADWIPVSTSKSLPVHVWEIQTGSQVSTPGGVSFLFRIVIAAKNHIIFERNYVSREDCDAGSGKLVSVDLDYTNKRSVDFVTGGGTVASKIAETICVIGGF